jgi:hypothetical protein
MNKVGLIVPFVLIAIAPFIGKWRANVWLKRHQQRERGQHMAESLVEQA